MYGDRFFKRRVSKYHKAEVKLAHILHSHYLPTAVFDAGCGIGSYLEGFRQRGATVAGCELGYEYAKPYMPPEVVPHVFGHDLAKPLPAIGTFFELVLCIEVAEHLPASGADQLVRNLASIVTRYGRDHIFFTAARPGQRGTGHINCQEPDYWIEKFAAVDCIYCEGPTERIKHVLDRNGNPLDLMHNVMIFCPKTGLNRGR